MATSIEWTDKTWNPVTGCDKVSPGCAHCYAETMAIRLWGKQYDLMQDDVSGVIRPRRFTDVLTHQDRLLEPLSWRKPARVRIYFTKHRGHLANYGESDPRPPYGHTFHEKTREQVADRNYRDRTLQQAGWVVLHFSWTEMTTRPEECIGEVLGVARDRFHSLTSHARRKAAERAAGNQAGAQTSQES